MSTLFASRLAPDVAIALQQAPGLGVRDLSRILNRTASSVQRTLPALLQAGAVVRDSAGSFSLNGDAGAALADRRLVLDSDSLRERLYDEPNLRARALRAVILKGTVERTFPDVTCHGDFASPAIHALNPALRRPAATRLRELADRFGLRRIVVFGSAVRRDLRPDSDVDVLIEPEHPDRVDLDSYLGTREALEALFGRRVDLVVRGTLRPSVAERANAEGVAIYERSRPRRSSSAA